jgi:hypothetical protein
LVGAKQERAVLTWANMSMGMLVVSAKNPCMRFDLELSPLQARFRGGSVPVSSWSLSSSGIFELDREELGARVGVPDVAGLAAAPKRSIDLDKSINKHAHHAEN